MAIAKPPKSTGPDLRRVQTIEATSKDLKKHILISVLMILGGLVLKVVSGMGGNSFLQFTGSFGFVIGIIYYIAARMLIWWNHG